MIIKTKCFLCSGKQFQFLFKKENYNIVRCIKCKVVITLDKKLLRAHKPNLKNYIKEDYLKYYLSLEVQKTLSSRAEKSLQKIAKYADGKRLLDVGCSYGFFLQVAKKEGWQAEGIELCQKTVNYLHKHSDLTVYKGTLSNLKLEKKYDVLTYWDVLEHVSNPIQELKKGKKYLKKDGLLVVQSPNINSLSAKITKERFGFLCPDDHLTHFSPQTLRLVLIKAGFEVLEIKTISASSQQFSQLTRDYFPKQTSLPLIRLPILSLALFLDKFLPFMDELFIRTQALFLANDLVVAYARKK